MHKYRGITPNKFKEIGMQIDIREIHWLIIWYHVWY